MVMNMQMRAGPLLVMASDVPDAWYQPPQGFRVQLAPQNAGEFDRLFADLRGEGARIDMPSAETFWAERFAMFTDRFGTPWMLNFEGDRFRGAASA